MNDYDRVAIQVRESFSGLRMEMPVEKVFARGRLRRRRRARGLTAAATATAGAAAAVTLALGPAPALSGNAAGPPAASPGPVRLAAFSVTSGPGRSTTLILRKGPKYPRLDPSALREALARRGIPALVTVGAFCRSTPEAPAGLGQVLRPSTLPDGSNEMVIDGQAIPSGTRLSIGYFPQYVRMALIEDGAPLSCASTSHQPAVHITPSGTQIRG